MSQAVKIAETYVVDLAEVLEPFIRLMHKHRRTVPADEEPVRFDPLVTELFPCFVLLSFNGTAFAHTNHKDIVRFDLRTEIGIANFAGKQAIPVLLNQCAVRSFYFVRRLAQDFSEKQISSLSDMKRLDAKRFLPFNNRTITHMITSKLEKAK